MDSVKKQELEKIAAKIRIGALTAVTSASSGHPGGSLSIAEILAYLYFKEMNVDPKNPKAADRDRLVLSKGHTAPALYAALAERGFFPVDMTTGSLGLGFSAACGMALAGKLAGKDYRVWAILGDGEVEEGQVWEAAMFAAHKKLSKLAIFVDYNGLQIDGPVAEVAGPAPIDAKFAAFGWNVLTIDGHDLDAIEKAAEAAKASDKPTAIICNTVKGKGVSFMENQVKWHGSAPTQEQYEQAVAEITAAAGL